MKTGNQPAPQKGLARSRSLLEVLPSPPTLQPEARGCISGQALSKLSQVFVNSLDVYGLKQDVIAGLYEQMVRSGMVRSGVSLSGQNRALTQKEVAFQTDQTQYISSALPGYPQSLLQIQDKLVTQSRSLQVQILKKSLDIQCNVPRVHDLLSDPVHRFRYQTKMIEPGMTEFKHQAQSASKDWIGRQQLRLFKPLKSIYGHGASRSSDQGDQFVQIYNIAFDKSGKLLFSSDDTGLIKIWSTDTCLLLHSLVGHYMRLNVLWVSPCNKFLVSLCERMTRVWSLSLMRCVCVFALNEPQSYKQFLFYQVNSQSFFLLAYSNVLQIYKTTQFERLEAFSGGHDPRIFLQLHFKHPINTFSISQNGVLLVSLKTGELNLYNFNDLQDVLFTKQFQENDSAANLLWNERGDKLALIGQEGACKVFGLQMDFQLKFDHIIKFSYEKLAKGFEMSCLSICWSFDSRYLLSVHCKQKKSDQSYKCKLIVYDSNEQTKKIIAQYDQSFNPGIKFNTMIRFVQCHPKVMDVCFFADSIGQVVILNYLSGQILNMFWVTATHIFYPNLQIGILMGCFSPDGTRLAIASQYGSFQIYGNTYKDFYSYCPTEQFFTMDNEAFEYQNYIPISVSRHVNLDQASRGLICNANRDPYLFKYRNSFPSLRESLCQSEQVREPNRVQSSLQEQASYQKTIIKQISENRQRELLYQNHYQQHSQRLIRILAEVSVPLCPNYRIQDREKEKDLELEKLYLLNKKKLRPLRSEETETQLKRSRSKMSLEEANESSNRDREVSRESSIENKPTKKRKAMYLLQEQVTCSRCGQSSNPLSKCQSCSAQYCQFCAAVRKSLNRERCLLCHPLMVQEKRFFEVERNFLMSDQRQNFLPQVGERTTLVVHGLEECMLQILQEIDKAQLQNFLQEHKFSGHRTDLNQPFDLGIQSLFQVTIKDLRYSFPRTSKCGQAILMYLVQSQSSKRLVVVVKPSKATSVFVPQRLLEIVQVQLPICQQQQSYTVKDKHQKEYDWCKRQPYESNLPKSLFKCLRMGKNERKRKSGEVCVSPWMVLNFWKDDQKYWSNYYEDQLVSTRCDIMRIIIQDFINKNSQLTHEFVNPVNTHHYSNYLEFVVLPMCLNKIKTRIHKHFYRNFQAVIHDLALIHSNSVLFNGPQHPITLQAQEIVARLSTTLDKGEEERSGRTRARRQDQAESRMRIRTRTR